MSVTCNLSFSSSIFFPSKFHWESKLCKMFSAIDFIYRLSLVASVWASWTCLGEKANFLLRPSNHGKARNDLKPETQMPPRWLLPLVSTSLSVMDFLESARNNSCPTLTSLYFYQQRRKIALPLCLVLVFKISRNGSMSLLGLYANFWSNHYCQGGKVESWQLLFKLHDPKQQFPEAGRVKRQCK